MEVERGLDAIWNNSKKSRDFMVLIKEGMDQKQALVDVGKKWADESWAKLEHNKLKTHFKDYINH